MDLHNESSLSGQQAVLCGQNFNIVYYSQTVQPIFFILAMLIVTIAFYHLYHFQ